MKATTQSISTETKESLPRVLVDYLRKMIGKRHQTGLIWLLPCKLGANEVQDIVYESPEGSICRRVFGFPPVHACLEVLQRENELELAIA